LVTVLPIKRVCKFFVSHEGLDSKAVGTIMRMLDSPPDGLGVRGLSINFESLFLFLPIAVLRFLFPVTTSPDPFTFSRMLHQDGGKQSPVNFDRY